MMYPFSDIRDAQPASGQPDHRAIRIQPFFCCLLLAAIVPKAVAQSPDSTQADVSRICSSAPFPMPQIRIPTFPERLLNVRDFGAVCDAVTLNDKAINDAIVACSRAGGGRVIIPAGVWRSGPITILENVDLHLERGALLAFSNRLEDYPLIAGFDGKSRRYLITPPIHAYRAKNIGLTGEGIIDGNGDAWRYVKRAKLTAPQWEELVRSGGVVSSDGKEWWPSREAMEGEEYLGKITASGKSPTKDDYVHVREFLRPDLVVFVQCDGVLVDGVTLENSPKFHLRPQQSENIVIRDVHIMAPWYGQNTDGLDPSSCRNMVIERTTVDVGDDGICLKPASLASSQTKGPSCANILIVDCTVYHAHGGFVIGSESYGGVDNVYVHNCTFVGTDVGLRFKSARDRGGLVHHVTVDGIQMSGIENAAILFDMYYGGGSPDDERMKVDDTHAPKPVTDRTPRFEDFDIRNVACIGARQAVVVKALPEMPLRNIVFKNLNIASHEGVDLVQADGIEMTDCAIRPATGPVVRIDETKNLMIRRMSYPKGAEEFLQVKGEHSEGVKVEGVELSWALKAVNLSPEVRRNAVEIVP